jgi:hypothetical protein
MSNFNIFEDPTGPDGQSAFNPLPNPPPNPPHSTHYCTRCLHEKAITEFSPEELLLATPTPLGDVTNENISQKNKRRKNNGPTCITCREKIKRQSQARRAKADEAKQLERIPWKEVIRMIEEGFNSQSVRTY